MRGKHLNFLGFRNNSFTGTIKYLNILNVKALWRHKLSCDTINIDTLNISSSSAASSGCKEDWLVVAKSENATTVEHFCFTRVCH